MSIGERIRKARRTLDLTQAEFASRIKSTQNTVTRYETGDRTPSASVITLICREFDVSEEWLRTGEGEMFIPAPENSIDKLAEEFHLDSLDREIISEFVKLDGKSREAVKLYIRNVSRNLYLDATATAVVSKMEKAAPERTDADLAQKIAELERQNQELAAKVAAMEEEDGLGKLPDTGNLA